MATGAGFWVAGGDVFKSMIAAGATSEEAEKAVEQIYFEEEQRINAEQRYLDWLRGPIPKRGELSTGSRTSEPRT